MGIKLGFKSVGRRGRIGIIKVIVFILIVIKKGLSLKRDLAYLGYKLLYKLLGFSIPGTYVPLE